MVWAVNSDGGRHAHLDQFQGFVKIAVALSYCGAYGVIYIADIRAFLALKSNANGQTLLVIFHCFVVLFCFPVQLSIAFYCTSSM